MALAVTRLGTATFDTNSGTKTVTATPAVGDLIIIITAHSGNTSAATPTDNNSSGTYTKITSATGQSSADTLSVFVRNSLIGAANSTVFSHAPGTSTGGGLAVIKVTGMSRSGASAILQSAIQNNQASGGTPAPVFGSAAQTTNAVISAVMNVTNPAGVSVRSSPLYTARVSAGYTVPTTGLGAMSIDSGETGTSIAWGSASASAFCSLAIEVDATSLPTGIGSSSGASTVTGVGKAQDKGSGSSTGSATASGVGKARDKGSGSSTGTGTASGVGKAKDKGAGASAGTGTASAVGKVLVKSAGSSSGAASATAAGKATASGVGSSTGAATPAGVGRALNLTVGSSDGSNRCWARRRYRHRDEFGIIVGNRDREGLRHWRRPL
jgi:hypothetical protein